MTTREAIPTLQFSEAKQHLSEVSNDVIRQHRPAMIERRASEPTVLARRDDLRRWLDSFAILTTVRVEDGEFLADAPTLGVAASGASFQEALESLAEEISAYAVDYLSRPGYYRETVRCAHEPMLVRFALTPAADRVQLLIDDSKRTSL